MIPRPEVPIQPIQPIEHSTGILKKGKTIGLGTNRRPRNSKNMSVIVTLTSK